jgi:hypothetical protein
MNERDIVTLHRRDDPSHEYREIILRADNLGASHWTVWEAVGFLSKPDVSFTKRHELFHGWEQNAREFFAVTVQRLRGEGFVECVSDEARNLNIKRQ